MRKGIRGSRSDDYDGRHLENYGNHRRRCTRVPAETTYALLEYNYSDGFILYPDRRTGNSMWFGGVNDAAGERFQWILVDEAWTITLTRSDGSKEDFTFQVSDLTDSRMDLQTPKGFRYQLGKQ